MALPQDGVNMNELPKTSTIPTGKELLFIDPTTNEGGVITLEDLTKQILQNLTSQTFALDQGTKTLPAALNELNSKTFRTGFPAGTSSFYSSVSGIYKLTTDNYSTFPDKPDNFAGRAVWIYNSSSDERIGLLMSSLHGRIAIGYCFGDTKLTWKEL